MDEIFSKYTNVQSYKKVLHLMGERVRIAIRWLRSYAVWGNITLADWVCAVFFSFLFPFLQMTFLVLLALEIMGTEISLLVGFKALSIAFINLVCFERTCCNDSTKLCLISATMMSWVRVWVDLRLFTTQFFDKVKRFKLENGNKRSFAKNWTNFCK